MKNKLLFFHRVEFFIPFSSLFSVLKAINDSETDKLPSTFWITNLKNKFIGNVAGGSEDSGFVPPQKSFIFWFLTDI